MTISLRTLLLLTVLICFPMAGFVGRHRGRVAVAQFAEQRGKVFWSYHRIGWWDYKKQDSSENLAAFWLRWLLGEHVLASLRRLSLNLETDADFNTVNRLFKKRRALRGLEVLELADKRAKGAANAALEAQVLSGLDDVRFFTLTGFKLDAQTFESIAGIEDLEILILVECEFEVSDLKPLAEANHLAWIVVPKNQVLGEKVHEVRAMLPYVFVSY